MPILKEQMFKKLKKKISSHPVCTQKKKNGWVRSKLYNIWGSTDLW